VINIEFEHSPSHRPTHLIARKKFVDELDTGGVSQKRSMTAQCLGEQRPRHAGMMQRSGMELDELDIGHRNTGSQGHRDTITGGFDRIRGDGEELTRTTSGEQHMAGPNHSRDTRAISSPNSDTPTLLHHEVERELVLVDGRR